MKFLLAFLCFTLALASPNTLISFKIKSAQERERLNGLIQPCEKYDVWTGDCNLIIGDNHVLADEPLVALLKGMRYEPVVLCPDMRKAIEAEQREIEEIKLNATASWFDNYHSYDEIKTYIDNQIIGVYDGNTGLSITKTVIGTSIEGRDILGLKITDTSSSPTKVVYNQAMQHSREWIGPHALLYTLNYILSEFVDDSSSKSHSLLSQATLYVIPVVNPDGYEYSRQSSSTRLWRKNRRNNGDGTYGVDLNRNWDSNWGNGGSSSNPSSDTYMGTAPFSEPETLTASNWMTNVVKPAGDVVAAIDWHAYSQLILRPYGDSQSFCPDEVNLKNMGDTLRQNIYDVHGKSYKNIRSIELYLTTGSASDWWYKGRNGATSGPSVPVSITYELRPDDSFFSEGFKLSPQYIIPQGQEIAGPTVEYFLEALNKY